MKKEIREVDQKRGILQITTTDERWYARSIENPVTKLPEWKFVPSVTWIAGHYPKGIGFYKWLADKGWDEAEAIKVAAGDKGSKVHTAISAILSGEEVRIDSKFVNNSTGQEEELTTEEIECIKSFVDWRNEVKPVSIAWDVTIFSEKHNYAGTIDYICKIGELIYIIDFKTSQQVWTEMEMQVSAYKQAIENGENPIFLEHGQVMDASNIKLGILQIGYKRNKNFYKWNEIEDVFPLFLNAKAIWKRECDGQTPKQRDFPIILSPAVPKEVVIDVDKVADKLSKAKKIK